MLKSSRIKHSHHIPPESAIRGVVKLRRKLSSTSTGGGLNYMNVFFGAPASRVWPFIVTVDPIIIIVVIIGVITVVVVMIIISAPRFTLL